METPGIDLEEEFETFFGERKGQFRILLDIGAAQGACTIPFLRHNPRGLAIIVEPNLAMIGQLVEEAQKSGYDNRVLPIAGAVWSQPGLLMLYGRIINEMRLEKDGSRTSLTGNYGQVGLVYQNASPIGWTITTTLDHIISRIQGPISFMKIDTEGAEHIFLPQTRQETLRRAEYIHLDTHDVSDKNYFADEWQASDLGKVMTDAGFVSLGHPLWKRI